MREPRSSRERILFLLKTDGPQTANALARRLDVSPTGIRQHLSVLEGQGLVAYQTERPRRGKVGRRGRVWRLTPSATDAFPNSHEELTVGLLRAIERAFGQEGLERLSEERTREQITTYRARMPGLGLPLDDRVDALTTIRCEEGFLAEWSRKPDGSIELVENHCAIMRAAETCPALCAGELSLFRSVLGENVSVDRAEHVLCGDRRCVYRIAAVGA